MNRSARRRNSGRLILTAAATMILLDVPVATAVRASYSYTNIAAGPDGYWIQQGDDPAVKPHPSPHTTTWGNVSSFDSVNANGRIASIPGKEGYFVVGGGRKIL